MKSADAIIALRFIPPPPTPLAAAAAALSSGQWGTVTVGNQMNADPTGTGDGMFSYSPEVIWDSLHNVLRFWGACHGSAANVQRFHLGTYTDSTNLWTPTPSTAPVSAGTGGAHTYYAGTVDQQTGDFYGASPFYSLSTIYRHRYSTQTWDTPLPSNTTWGAHCSGIAVVYHPGLYGGQGGLVVASNSGIWTLNPRAGSPTWTVIYNRINQIDAMGDFPVGIYDYKTQCVYVGGGSPTTTLWKIGASATTGADSISACALPSLGLNPSTGTCIMSSSGNAANSLVLMDRSGAVQQFDGTTWSNVSTTVPSSMLSATDQWWDAGACPAYGCIVFPKGERSPGPKTSTTMHIWKR